MKLSMPLNLRRRINLCNKGYISIDFGLSTFRYGVIIPNDLLQWNIYFLGRSLLISGEAYLFKTKKEQLNYIKGLDINLLKSASFNIDISPTKGS